MSQEISVTCPEDAVEYMTTEGSKETLRLKGSSQCFRLLGCEACVSNLQGHQVRQWSNACGGQPSLGKEKN